MEGADHPGREEAGEDHRGGSSDAHTALGVLHLDLLVVTGGKPGFLVNAC
jgi:hypothetical protein